jgi:SAM-dependent methyltransferase
VCIALGYIDLKQEPEEYLERTHYYLDSGGLEFHKVMSNFDITPADAIVDLGCGKGGVLISLTKYPFSKITGVEISPDKVKIARKNLAKLKINNVNIECCAAEHFKDLSEYNYFYFFNPFPCTVMKEVLNNIEKSLMQNWRRVTIIYLNPLCHDLIESSDLFSKKKELPHRDEKCYIYSNL